jgi:type IX secretion system PorP/SprF family membrane protein
MMFDRAGTVALTTTQFLPALNFHKSMSESRNTYLSLGFMGGVVSRRLDRSKVTTNNQYDGFSYNGSLPDGETFASDYTYLDMTVGMSLSTTLGAEEEHLVFGGIAYHHFNKPVNAFYRNITHLPRWVVSTGLKLKMDPWSSVTFHADYNKQGTGSMLVGGGMYSRKVGDEDEATYTLHMGAYYRWNDAVIPVVKLDYHPFSVAFSYDVNVSELKAASAGRGGFEVSLSYVSFVNSDKSSYEKVKCPRF